MNLERLMLRIKNILKYFLQNFYLPLLYKKSNEKINKKLIVFANSHSEEMPYSMSYLHKELKLRGDFEIVNCFFDINKQSLIKTLYYYSKFMRLYSSAKYVVICDYFLPVDSCKKNKQTIVLQLWHSCGLMKKFAYDSEEDISGEYKGRLFKNCDYFTVSSDYCVDFIANAINQDKSKVIPTGISRTDWYFDEKYQEKCRIKFYKIYPKLKGKKILLWAPTFRNNARFPKLVGEKEIKLLKEKLPSDYHLIIKVHPHLENKISMKNCKIETHELLPVIDVLITDYSSIIFDYLIFNKPFICFTPDLKEYIKKRGLYIDYNSLSDKVALDEKELLFQVLNIDKIDLKSYKEIKKNHINKCDGNSTKRIIKKVFNI